MPVPPPCLRLSLSVHKDLSDHMSDSAGRQKTWGDGGNGGEDGAPASLLTYPHVPAWKGDSG